VFWEYSSWLAQFFASRFSPVGFVRGNIRGNTPSHRATAANAGDRVRVAELLLLGFGLAENAEDDEEWEAFHDSTNSIRKFRIQKSRIQNDRSGFIAKIGDNPDFKIQIWKIFWKILKIFPDLTNWNHPIIQILTMDSTAQKIKMEPLF
jgi:hypothetical protein